MEFNMDFVHAHLYHITLGSLVVLIIFAIYVLASGTATIFGYIFAVFALWVAGATLVANVLDKRRGDVKAVYVNESPMLYSAPM